MADISGELTNEVQVSYLSGRMAVGARCEGVYQRFMVSENVKMPPLQEIPEVLDGQVDGQQLTVVRAVARFCWLQSSGEKRERTPLSINILL